MKRRQFGTAVAAGAALALGVRTASAATSPDGTTIPSATQITDAQGAVWTVVNGVVKRNGRNAGFTTLVQLLLWYGGVIYQENTDPNWWKWVNSAWVATTDPRGMTATLTVSAPIAGASGSSPIAVSGSTNQTSVVVKEGSTVLATLTPTGGNFSGSVTLATGAHTIVFTAGTATPVSRSITVTAPVVGKLFYGVNLHPGASIYQSLGTGPVINYMHDIGFTVARMDFYGPGDAALATTWCSALAAANITPLPILISSRVDGDETTSYNNGFALGQAIANAAKTYTTYYEMGNEIDDQCSPQLDGLTPACYDQNQWVAARGAMRGAYAGVKSVQPGATLIFAGITVLDEGFINGMATGVEPSGATGRPIVQFDATAGHWYETSGDPTNTGSSGGNAPCGSPNAGLNMLSFLGGSGDGKGGTSQWPAGKGAWWTEIGNAAADNQADQAAYVTAICTQLYNTRVQYHITNFCWYELIAVAGSGGAYGLIASNGTTKFTAYTTMKNFIAAHPV